MASLRRSTNAYLGFLGLLTIAFVGFALRVSDTPQDGDVLLAVLVTGCTALTIAVPIRVDSQQKLTLYSSTMFAGVLLLDPGVAIISVGLGTVIGQLVRHVPRVELLFNMLQTVLQTGAASFVLWWAGWNFDVLTTKDVVMVPIVILTILVIEAVNIVLVAGMMTLESSASLRTALRAVAPQDFVSMASPYTLGLLAAIIIEAHFWALPLLALLAVELRRSSDRHAQLRQQAVAMEHQASHDALTGIPNRRLFVERVEQAMARATRHGTRIAVLFVDLDRFKPINDTLGHAVGDKLLVAVAQRLSDQIRPQDTIARIGGDEFTLLVDDIEEPGDAEGLAVRLAETLCDPFVIDDHRIALSVSIGVALNQLAETSAADLIRHADIAQYQAKARGGNFIALFNDRDNDLRPVGETLETDLRQANTTGELHLH